MIEMDVPVWEAKRTEESRMVEDTLRRVGRFAQADAYHYNSASIRVRVIDPRFEGMSLEARDALVEPILDQLPEETQADIMSLLTFAPSETVQSRKTAPEPSKRWTHSPLTSFSPTSKCQPWVGSTCSRR